MVSGVYSSDKQRMEHADAMFPDSDAGFKIRASHNGGIASEISSLREARDNGQEVANMPGFDWMLDCNRRRMLQRVQQSIDGRFDWRNNKADYAELASLMKR